MSTTTTATHPIMPPAMRPVPLQESPVSRPRAVYSIDQILGNQHQSKRSGKLKKKTISQNYIGLYGVLVPSVFCKTEEHELDIVIDLFLQ